MLEPSPIYTEVWTIDETQKDQWDCFLQENAITMDYLQDVFKRHQAARIEFAPVLSEKLQRALKEPQQKIPYWIWGDQVVEVYLAPYPRTMNHLWVVLKRPVESLCDVTEDENIAMRSTVQKIQFFLRTHFATPTFVAQWNQPQPGHFPKRFTIEVIPARPESTSVLNSCDKVECNNYLLWRNRFSNLLPETTQEEAISTLFFWQSALQESSLSFSTNKENEPMNPVSILRTQITERTGILRDCIFQILEQHFSIERKKAGEIIEVSDTWMNGKNTCTFCSQKIIDAEKVFESELSYVLYNYKPCVPGAHFLIFPKKAYC